MIVDLLSGNILTSHVSVICHLNLVHEGAPGVLEQLNSHVHLPAITVVVNVPSEASSLPDLLDGGLSTLNGDANRIDNLTIPLHGYILVAFQALSDSLQLDPKLVTWMRRVRTCR